MVFGLDNYKVFSTFLIHLSGGNSLSCLERHNNLLFEGMNDLFYQHSLTANLFFLRYGFCFQALFFLPNKLVKIVTSSQLAC